MTYSDPNPGLTVLHSRPPPFLEDFGMMRHESLEKRLKHDGHRPPQRSEGPKGPRFGLLRRIVRLIRGGGD